MQPDDAVQLAITDMTNVYHRLMEASKKQNGEPSYSGPSCLNRSMANTISNWIHLLKTSQQEKTNEAR